jgi:hypothetical protein
VPPKTPLGSALSGANMLALAVLPASVHRTMSLGNSSAHLGLSDRLSSHDQVAALPEQLSLFKTLPASSPATLGRPCRPPCSQLTAALVGELSRTESRARWQPRVSPCASALPRAKCAWGR